MKKTLLFSMLFAFCFSLTAPASAQLVKPRKPGDSASAPAAAQPAASQPTPAQAVPAAKPDTLVITTTSLPDAEVGRLYSKSSSGFELKASGGKEPYVFDIKSEGANWLTSYGGSDLYGLPNKEGVSDVTVTAQDSSDPRQEATRTLKLKVGPPTLYGVQEHLDIVAKGGDLNKLSYDLTRILQSNTMETRERIDAIAKRVNRDHELLKYYWGWRWYLGFIVIAALFGLLGLLVQSHRTLRQISALKGQFNTTTVREKAAHPRDRELRDIMGVDDQRPRGPGHAVVAFFVLCSLVGSVYAQAQQAKLPGRIISIRPDAVVVGTEVEVTISGGGLKDVTSLQFPSGITISEVKATVSQVKAKVKVPATNYTTGPNSFNLLGKDSTKIAESGDKITLFVLTSDQAMVVDYLQNKMNGLSAADPTARHFLQAFFQVVYGKDDGNKKWIDYRKKPSHDAANALLKDEAHQIIVAAGQETGQKMDEALGKLNEATAAVQQAKDEFGKTAESVRSEVQVYADQKAGEVKQEIVSLSEAHTKTREALTEVGGAVQEMGNTTVLHRRPVPIIPGVAVGGKKGPLSPEVAKRVAEALERMKQ